MTDVLIIGAGPAGSAAAAWLAERGWRVRLVDRATFPRPKPCGEYYSPRCWELLAELGALPRLLRADVARHESLLFGTTTGATLHTPFARTAAPGASAFSASRQTLDHTLVQHAVDLGVELEEGVNVREAIVEHERVVGARGRGAEGRAWECRARVVLAADGIRSAIARQLGLSASEPHRKFGVVMRFHGVPPDPVARMFIGGPGYCGLAVEPGGEANLGMVADERALPQIGGDPSAFFLRQLKDFPAFAPLLGNAEAAGKALTVGPMAWRTRRQALPGLLLVGDAAGFYDPITGQGVTWALETAQLAAECVDTALRSGSDLPFYEYERRRAALLGPRLRLQRLIQWLLAHPPILERAITALAADARLADTFTGAITDTRPPGAVLHPAYLARLIGRAAKCAS